MALVEKVPKPPSMTLLPNHPDADRIRKERLDGDTLTLIVDVSGLDEAERAALEDRLQASGRALCGVATVRVAMTAAKRGGPTIIAIGSGKGGVGKSTLTANLAVALAREGRRVGIVDADIYGPSQPTLLGVTEKPTAVDKVLQPVPTVSGVKLLSVGQMVPPGQALAWRGPMASGALNQLVEGNWGSVEILLIDLPPGTGDVQISLIQKARPAGAVIVSTPQDLSLIDAERAVDLFRRTDVRVLGLVENMAGYRCPHCGEVSDPFGQGGAEAGAARLHIPFLGRLPLSATIREASDAGTPPAATDGPAALAFADLARAIMAEVETIGA